MRENWKKIKGYNGNTYHFKKGSKIIRDTDPNRGILKTIVVKDDKVKLNIKGNYENYSYSNIIENLFK